MADKKISELTNITGANLADADEFVVVDTSANETKAITYAELKSGLDTSTGFVRVTGDTMTGDLSFGDNNKAIFGAGSDLQIYHDGSHSWIEETGTGDLYVRTNGSGMRFYDSANGYDMLRLYTGGSARLYNAGSQKLATTSTGVDVTGTVTADGLTVDGSNATANFGSNVVIQAANNVLSMADNAYFDGSWKYKTTAAASAITSYRGSEVLRVRSAASGTANTAITWSDKFKVDNNGDISFYEDTGTTAKLFWDASAEALGIGTSSPTNVKLQINGSLSGTAGTGHLAFGEASTPLWNWRMDATTADLMLDRSYGGWQSTPVIAFDRSSGNVGIGTSSPRTKLDIEGSFALDGDSATLATTTQTAIATYSASSFKGGKVIITANDGTDTYITELLIANTASTATATEYGQIGTGTFTVAYDVDVSGGNVRILATAPNSTSTTYKVAKNLM